MLQMLTQWAEKILAKRKCDAVSYMICRSKTYYKVYIYTFCTCIINVGIKNKVQNLQKIDVGSECFYSCNHIPPAVHL